MTVLLELKEKLKTLYTNYSYIVLPVAKFVLAMVVFLSISRTIGFFSLFENIFVLLILALICCLLPVNATVAAAGILVVGHSYALGIEVAAFAVILLLVLAIFFLRFVSRDGLALILTPLAFGLGIPCAAAIGYGLKRKPSAAVAVGCGTIVYYFLALLKEKSTIIQGTESSEIVTRIQLLLDGIIKNQALMLNLLALLIVLILVYAVRRMDMDYAWRIAIGVGVVVYLAVMISGGLFMDIQTSMAMVIVGALASGLVSLVLEFFLLSVDYSRVERLEYEDDEYVYYVKAVPKMTITTARRQIKTISDEEEEPEVLQPYRPTSESYMPDGGEFEPDLDDLFGETREKADINEEDLEKKLEESLKDL